MKISLFDNYGAKNSVSVFAAIEQGLRAVGHQVVKHDVDADAAVIWSMLWNGRMRPNREVWQQFQGRPIIVAEVGMLRRDHTWKIGLGGTGINAYRFDNLIPNRARQLGLTLKPWRQGSNVVIAVQRTDSEQWRGQPPLQQWLQNTVDEIRKHTDRPIMIRPHPRGSAVMPAGCFLQKPNFTAGTYDSYDFDRGLDTAWCVVNWSSGPGPQSVIAGVPAFVGPDSLASPIANWDFSQIENPPRPDRTAWLDRLAHTEWTVEEIASGVPFTHLGV